MMKCLDKRQMTSLMEEVVDPIYEMAKSHLNEIQLIKFKVALTKLAILFLMDDKEKIQALKNSGVSISMLYVEDDEMTRKIIKTFFELHSKWIENHCKQTNHQDIQNNEIDNQNDENNETDETDDFFDFDSEEVDDNISHMHYETHQKITAKEFMQQGKLDDDLIAELTSLVNDVDDFIFRYEDIEIDENFIEELSFLKYFIEAFEFSGEFVDIAYVLKTFQESIKSFDLHSENKEILKKMILAVLQDLDKWIKEVIIDQTAQDIHYLDASLLASISQIDIMMKAASSQSQDDDEMELF